MHFYNARMLTERDLISRGEIGSTYVSVRLVARELDVSELTVRRWLKTGVLPHVRFGRTIRIPRSAVYERKIVE